MLSYLHAFHAGNFADVHKHIGLLVAIQLLQRKPTAIACFDTHAGSARYDLEGDYARKTKEADAGFQQLWQCRNGLRNPLWRDIWSVIGVKRTDVRIRHYPGSPAWLSSLARSQDRVTAFELHSSESSRLQDWARTHKVKVVAGDGFKGLLAGLPPCEPRLFTLIDPPYEIKEDYPRTAETIQKAWQRCRHGVYLVWYPVLPEAQYQQMISRLQAGPGRKILHSQFVLDTPPPRGMRGSGLLLVNPPWEWAETLDALLNEVINSGAIAAKHKLEWVVPE